MDDVIDMTMDVTTSTTTTTSSMMNHAPAHYENVNLNDYQNMSSQIVHLPSAHQEHRYDDHHGTHRYHHTVGIGRCQKKTKMGYVGHPGEDYSPFLFQDPTSELNFKCTDPIDRIPTLNNQGIAMMERGDYDHALDYFRRCLTSLRDNVDPRYHASLLLADSTIWTTMKNKNSTIQKMNHNIDCAKIDYDEGMDYDLAPIVMDKVIVELIDTVHKSAMVTLYNLGVLSTTLNLYEEAVSCFNSALLLRRSEGHSSPVHIITLLRNIGCLHYNNSASATASATATGDGNSNNSNSNRKNEYLTKAMVAFEEAVQYRYSIADEDEISSLYNCIGVLHFHNQHPTTTVSVALQYFQEAVTIRRKLLNDGDDVAIGSEDHDHDDDNIRIATYLNNIGRCLYLQGDYDQALDQYSEALTIRRELLSSDGKTHHLDCAATVYNIGQTYHRMEDSNDNRTQAIKYYEEFIAIAGQKLGRTHRDLLTTYKSIAQLYHSQHKYEDAIAYLEEALRASTLNYKSINHQENASILNKMGNLWYEHGDNIRALERYKQGLAIERNVLHPLHPNIIVTLTNIGHIAKQMKSFQLALEYYNDALENQKKSFNGSTDGDDSHPNIAITLSNIALIHYEQRAYTDSLDVYQDALRIRRDVHGDMHLDVASSLNSIGLVLFKLGYHDLSLRSFCECLKTRRHILGKDHRDIAIILYNIATIHMERNEEDLAQECYQETLRIERNILGPNHIDLTLTMQHLGQIQHHRGEYESALQYYTEILRIERINIKIGDPALGASSSIIQTLIDTSEIHMEHGSIAKMMSTMTEAARLLSFSNSSNEIRSLLTSSSASFHYDLAVNPKSAAAA